MVTTRAFFASRPLLVVSIGLVVIAAVCAGWFGLTSQPSSASAGTTAACGGTVDAQMVEQILKQGEQDVQAFNTLSYKNLSQGLAQWQDASTGVLRSETVSGWASFAKEVAKAQTTTTATVLEGSLTSLNTAKCTAGVIVAVQLTVTPVKGSAATKRNRLEGTLTRTASGWKLSSLSIVPVGTTQSSSP